MRELSELSDDALMQRIQQQDEQAFTLLVDRYMTALHGFVWRMLGNSSDVEDVVQETFLRVWYRAEQWQEGRAKLSTWMHRIAHNLCIDLYRQNRGIKVDIELEEVQNVATATQPEDIWLQAEISQQVEHALQALPEKQRSAVILCHYQGMSNRQAAEVMDVSVAALESLLARGRRTLRVKLTINS